MRTQHSFLAVPELAYSISNLLKDNNNNQIHEIDLFMYVLNMLVFI